MKMIGLPGHRVFGREEGVMNTTSTLVKKSLQWSIALSVLMIAAGVLAIVVPGLRGWP
jgi:predicted anti-sigma-YlaC factor YlaD